MLKGIFLHEKFIGNIHIVVNSNSLNPTIITLEIVELKFLTTYLKFPIRGFSILWCAGPSVFLVKSNLQVRFVLNCNAFF